MGFAPLQHLNDLQYDGFYLIDLNCINCLQVGDLLFFPRDVIVLLSYIIDIAILCCVIFSFFPRKTCSKIFPQQNAVGVA